MVVGRARWEIVTLGEWKGGKDHRRQLTEEKSSLDDTNNTYIVWWWVEFEFNADGSKNESN